MERVWEQKIKKLEDLRQISSELKKSGKKVVHCHGVYDLLHPGHIRHFNSAKEYGDILVVTITADRFVRKGPGRPAFNQNLRAESLANIAAVDFVCVLEYPTGIEGIIAIKPDFYVKGPDYKKKEDDITAKIFEEEDAVEAVGGQMVFTEDLQFSSSKLINAYLDTYPQHVMEYLKNIASKYELNYVLETLASIKDIKILMIGDTIIDEYHYCSPLGKSAKESIVANKYLSEEQFAGGCLGTANHVAQLTRNVDLLTVLGEKDSKEDLVRSRLDPYINPQLVKRRDCVTTTKRRYISVDGGTKKLFEVVFIDDHLLTGKEETEVLSFLDGNIESYDLVIVSDYGHGLITKSIMELLCRRAKCLALNVQTNSANLGFNLVTKYKRADFVCIDERELRLATQDRFSDLNLLIENVQGILGCKQIVSTRGAKGALSYNAQEGFHESVAFAQQSVDTMGSGDAFYGYAAACFAIGMSQDLISFVGNAAGAIKVQIVGNREPVRYVDLAKFITRLFKV